MADRQFVPLGSVNAPADWVIPDSLEIVPKLAYASYNGASASGPFLPCLRVISDSGHVAAEAIGTTQVAAGGSADVSWFQGLAPQASGGGSTQAMLMCLTNIGTSQTIPAGTSRLISFDSIQTDSSGYFDVGLGHGTTFHVLKAGTFFVQFAMTPSANWPAAGSAPLVMNTNTLNDLDDQLSSLVDPDGSNQTIMFTGFAVSGSTLPARMSISIFNHSATDVITFGSDVQAVVNLISPDSFT